MPFILPLEGPVRQRMEQWFRQKNIKHPTIYATVAGHEGISFNGVFRMWISNTARCINQK